MNEAIRERLSKVYALFTNGATDGERQAAKVALDKILDKYNITEAELANINLKRYWFTYTSQLEVLLLILICKQCCGIESYMGKDKSCRSICLDLTYLDWVSIESMYEYFRRHMKKEWLLHSKTAIAKCRKTKTKNEMRRVLQDKFFSIYISRSSLYREKDFTQTKATATEYELARHFTTVEGGNFNKQVITHKLIS
jgi:hypothetical protein